MTSDSDGVTVPVLQDAVAAGAIADHLRRYRQLPAEAHLWDATPSGGFKNTPTLLLTTTGRRTGRQLTWPLIYGRDGDNYAIVASKGGAPEHPSWYLNLLATPQIEVQVAERKFSATPRTAVGEERRRIWQIMCEIYPPYDHYQTLTTREIPVVVLEPKTSSETTQRL